MKRFLASLCLLGFLLLAVPQCTLPASEFHLQGDYLLGGLFDVHHAVGSVVHVRPEAIDCSSQQFTLPSYRMFQVMRFSIEEINNSTSLLPNISLGYEIFDHCSDTLNFPGVFKLISVNGSIREGNNYMSKVMAVIGPFGSTETLTVAPFFMMNLIPMVNYGSASSVLSEKQRFPSFLRTVHPNKDIIQVIIHLMQYFNWRWVAFLKSSDAYSTDGLELFKKLIKGTEICLAYTEELQLNTNYSRMYKEIEAQKISTIIIFALKKHVEPAIESAIQFNVTNKVWIAGDTWSLNKKLPKLKGIQNIGTILGVSETVVAIPGFHDFIYSSKDQKHCENAGQETFCNQVCNCSSLNPEEVIAENPSYSFPIYSAAYAIAHAIHNVLKCGVGKCRNNITVYPYMVLEELKKSNFTLLNQVIQFDENGDPKHASYSIVFWNRTGDAEEVGLYENRPSVYFSINNTKIHWHANGKVPISECSPECDAGYKKKKDGIHKCCFHCEICLNGTYENRTEDPYRCMRCQETEWSVDGSTSCTPRSVEYVPFTDGVAILIMVATCALVGLSLAMAVLFATNYNTPVVKSAGGSMCFLILGCLSVCSLSVFFYFGKPTGAYCILRYLPFLLFYTPCLACFVVRSFQIVCIFKMAAKFPKLHSWWMKYNGQWVVITVAFFTQALLLTIEYASGPHKPYNETFWYADKIIISCEIGKFKAFTISVLFLGFLCSLCFVFSYMGKDLPKNYNEAKAITFCLFLLSITWIIFATEYIMYHGKYIQTLNALAVLSSLYSVLLWYFLPKCYIIIFQPHKNTQQYFQGLIQSYTKNISK
ncbi:taste receptor type 1 member 2.2 [Centroberyx affinis]|uniref:taste receptor type 1 member 2.2 n=1 Tax=Centroberyx affinis TaxID=166261 RepID=UPI003A5C41E4